MALTIFAGVLFVGVSFAVPSINYSKQFSTSLSRYATTAQSGSARLSEIRETYLDSPGTTLAWQLCLADYVNAQAHLSLMMLDITARYQKEALPDALAEADDVLKAKLRCTPTDGNTWLQLAKVKRAQGDDWLSHLRQSRRFSSANYLAIRERLSLLVIDPDSWNEEAVNAAVELSIFFDQGRFNDIEALYLIAHETVRPVILDTLERVHTQKWERLTKKLKKLSVRTPT
ncbi:MAG: hypothetical protein AAFW47_01155 [Pseudomonadota bacterium]